MPRARYGRLARLAPALVACLVVLTMACVSPTLPLPPPATPILQSGPSPDTFRLTSVQGAEPNALIVVLNRNEVLPRAKRVTATLADERGSWDLTVFATTGDILDISQESGSMQSGAATVTVP